MLQNKRSDCTREHLDPQSFQGPKAGPGPSRMGRVLRARDVRYAHIIWCPLQILPISVFQKLASL